MRSLPTKNNSAICVASKRSTGELEHINNSMVVGNGNVSVADSHSTCSSSSELDEENTCSICLCGDENGRTYIQGSACCHQFHKECLFEWLALQNTCPCCRQEIIFGRCKLIRKAPPLQQKKVRKTFVQNIKLLFAKREPVDEDEALEHALETLANARLWIFDEPRN
mmetsp:Transcript_15819/g.22617  ORF Transcript_15819/g.22617 Transcript_15819/m.22617 type:complete len:167 (+) Transcript_15819:137-637(+)